MLDFYSIETELNYRKEQMNKARSKVKINEQQKLWFKLKEMYSRITLSKTKDNSAECKYECVC